MSHLLAIDVGNTDITLGLFQNKRLIHTWRLSTHRHTTRDELGIHLLNLLHAADIAVASVHGIVLASVVPSTDAPLREACQYYLHRSPLVVGPDIKLGIRNCYKHPEEVGADRLVNAVAIYALEKKAAIIVDFGTATTFDCVSAKGDYLGGVIAPGLAIANETLALRTAKLPRVTLQIPKQALGKTTEESLQSGLFWGYIGLIEGILAQLKKEMQKKPRIAATGGLSTMIGPHLPSVERIIPTLTLDGLRLIWEQNQ